MKKILFVCLGNICRSPMAECILNDMVKNKNIGENFEIDSAATCTDEVGNTIYPNAKRKLESKGIQIINHKARQITKKDYEYFDYILCMEESNIRNVKKIVGEDINSKIYRLLDFTENPRDIADPWYTRNFDITYDEIVEGCEKFLEYLSRKGE